ncbi:MAG: hypothetical protein ACRYF3_00205 [Janthinobacterium lividum]
MNATDGGADAELRRLLIEQFASFNVALQRIDEHLSAIDGHLRHAVPAPIDTTVSAPAAAVALPPAEEATSRFEQETPPTPSRVDPAPEWPSPVEKTPDAVDPPAIPRSGADAGITRPQPAPPGNPYPWPTVRQPPKRSSVTASSSDLLGRVFVIGGAVFTLVAIVLLLVMGAQRGLIGPGVRVAGLLVLSGALIGAATRVRSRWRNEVAATAVAGVGLSGGYLAVISCSAVYGWIPAVAGLWLALLIALAGLELARAWSAQALALGAMAAVGVSWQIIGARAGVDASVVAAFIVVLALACGRLCWLRQEWVALSVVTLSVLWLYQTGAAALVAPESDTASMTAATVAVVLVSSALAWLWSILAYRTRGGPGYLTSAAALYGLPVLVLGTDQGYDQSFRDVVLGFVGLTLVLVITADAFVRRARGRTRLLPPPIRVTFWALAAAYLLALTLQHTSGSAQLAALFAQALVIGVASRVARTKTSFFISLAFTLVGMIQLFEAMPLDAFWSRYETSRIATWPLALAATLLLAGVISSLGVAAQLFPRTFTTRRLWLAYLPVGWYALIGATIVSGTRLFDGTATVVPPTSPTGSAPNPGCPPYGEDYLACQGDLAATPPPLRADTVPGVDGFLVGIMAATLLLAIVSFVLLALFINGRDGLFARAYNPVHRSVYRTAGLLTLGVTAGKVVLIDTTSLDTFYRVGAYLGTGLLLMVLGARFGRQLTTSAATPEGDAAATTGSPGSWQDGSAEDEKAGNEKAGNEEAGAPGPKTMLRATDPDDEHYGKPPRF